MGKNQSLNLPYPLILASTSKYRANLLKQLGWIFQTYPPDVDEESFKNQIKDPEDLALHLARLKAKAVYLKNEGSCVIGSDQVCRIEQQIFSKPHSKEGAFKQLSTLQGQCHELVTAVCIITPEKEISFLNKTKLHMRELNPEEIHSYIERDLPLDCAGSYKLESHGIKLFHKIEMTDHTAIIGLPLIEVSNILIDLGYPF